MADQANPRAEGRWAGAATGTGYVGIISLIPDSYASFREVLLYVSPSIAVVVGWGWAVARAKILRHLNDSELADAIRRAGVVRDEIYANPDSTDEMKNNAAG